MVKRYQAIYDHGQLEWIDPPPTCERAQVLILIEESGDRDISTDEPNGNELVRIIEQIPVEARAQLIEKFGSPEKWQQEQRRERPLPGRNDS